jgi:hypothetical protein
MLGLAQAAAVVVALLAPAVAYVAYSASQIGVTVPGVAIVHGGPGPLAGAGGLGLLVAGGVFWLMRRRRAI